MKLDNEMWAYALRNSIEFGKTDAGKILPKLFNHGLDKKEIGKIMPKVREIVKKVNSLKKEEREKEYKNYKKYVKERDLGREDELPELEDVDKKKGVIMRFAPSPSGPLHIGHAATGMPSAVYVKRYGGKFYIRIEDTNPENIDPSAYEMIPEEATWLFGKNEVIIQSDRLELYYKYAEELIKKGGAYVCTCDNEKFKKLIADGVACKDRELDVKENLERFRKMMDKKEYKEGEAVLRFKSNLKDPNPALRDFPLARINESKHPRMGNKYRVWPLMNLSVSVDDLETGVTHAIRAKEHMDNAKRQEMMAKVLGKKSPKAYFLGRYNFTDMEVSCSKTRAKIKEGAYIGWDDIRLPFIAALRKRGFKPAAFEKMASLRGLSSVDKVLSQEDYFALLGKLNAEAIGKEYVRASFERKKKKDKESVEVLMPSKESIFGKTDLEIEKLEEGRMIYFVNLGYCCYNPKEKIKFWFAHK